MASYASLVVGLAGCNAILGFDITVAISTGTFLALDIFKRLFFFIVNMVALLAFLFESLGMPIVQ
jgi:hypothetical protein